MGQHAAHERSPLLIVARADRANDRVCLQLTRPSWSCWKQAEVLYHGPDWNLIFPVLIHNSLTGEGGEEALEFTSMLMLFNVSLKSRCSFKVWIQFQLLPVFPHLFPDFGFLIL